MDRIKFVSIEATRQATSRPATQERKPLTAEQRAEMKAAFTATMAAAGARYGKPRTIADAAGESSDRIRFQST